jgi:signal transduction histidine kinase/CheY-like chemotaxis protein
MPTPINVLIVEDRPADAEIMARELRRAGFDCHWRRVESESEYVAGLDEDPDLILADYSLPQFGALRALHLLKDSGLDIPLIVITGSISEEAAVQCMKLGASDYLLKDRLARLGEAARQALQQMQLRREKRSTEVALRESQQKTQALINAIPDLIFRFSRDGVYLDYKADNLDALLVPPEEFLGKSVFEIVPTAAPKLIQAIEQALQTGAIQVFEYPLHFRDALRDFEARIVASGQNEAVAIVREITERKRRERELEAVVTVANALRVARSRADMLAAILGCLQDVLKADVATLATLDPETNEIVFELTQGLHGTTPGLRTPAGEGLTGYAFTTGQAVLTNDLPNDSRVVRRDAIEDNTAAACAPLIADERIIGVLAIGRRTSITDDEFRIFKAISDISANALHRVGIVETLEKRVADRTAALEAVNERLQELDRLKSKFVSDVSHELRTPVTNLNMRLYLLERDDEANRAGHVAALKEQLGRFKTLIDNILDLSRLELGASRTVFAQVDLNSVVEQTVTAHVPHAEAVGLHLRFEPTAGLPSIIGERNQLSQVVTNLLINAINYTPAGEVIVQTYYDEDRKRVCLTIHDTGIGIEPEDVPHLFERFYRGTQASRAGIPGTGLGLGIVKEIIDLHGGVVEVNSEVGKGSEFRVCLPLDAGH